MFPLSWLTNDYYSPGKIFIEKCFNIAVYILLTIISMLGIRGFNIIELWLAGHPMVPKLKGVRNDNILNCDWSIAYKTIQCMFQLVVATKAESSLSGNI